MPEDVIINCSEDSQYPEPPEGHTWKEIRHDKTATWLSSWTEKTSEGPSVQYLRVDPTFEFRNEESDISGYEVSEIGSPDMVSKLRSQRGISIY